MYPYCTNLLRYQIALEKSLDIIILAYLKTLPNIHRLGFGQLSDLIVQKQLNINQFRDTTIDNNNIIIIILIIFIINLIYFEKPLFYCVNYSKTHYE